MRVGVRSATGFVLVALGARWFGLVCLALLGVGSLLPRVANAQDWPAATIQYCASGFCNSTPAPSMASACQNYNGATFTSAVVDYVAPTMPGATSWSFGCTTEATGTAPQTGTITYTCTTGWTASPSTGTCINNTCADTGGRNVAFDVIVPGASTCGTAPAYVCLSNSCRGAVLSASCMAFAASGSAPASAFWSGMAQTVTSEPCQTTDKTVTANLIGTDAKERTSGGGPGVATGSNLDSTTINTARTATNTAKIVELLQGGSGTGGGGGGSCGGSGQPACAIAEGDTSSQAAAMDTLMSGSQAGMESTMSGVASGLTSPPSFLPGGVSWLPNFTSILPTAACSWSQSISMPGMSAFNLDISVCAWGDYARDILGFVLYLSSIVFIFFTLFRGGQ